MTSLNELRNILTAIATETEPEQLPTSFEYTTSPQVRVSMDGSGDGVLHCPNCNGEYLHHEGITSYDRKEDAELTTVSSVSKGQVTSHLKQNPDNPSERRDGLRIKFSCELCEVSDLSLTIAQHKGSSLVKWEYKKPVYEKEVSPDEVEWKISQKGNPWAIILGMTVTIFPQSNRFKWCIADNTERQYSKSFNTVEEAKADVIKFLKVAT